MDRLGVNILVVFNTIPFSATISYGINMHCVNNSGIIILVYGFITPHSC